MTPGRLPPKTSVTLEVDADLLASVQGRIDAGLWPSLEILVEGALGELLLREPPDQNRRLSQAYEEGVRDIEAHGTVPFGREDIERIISESRAALEARRPAAE